MWPRWGGRGLLSNWFGIFFLIPSYTCKEAVTEKVDLGLTPHWSINVWWESLSLQCVSRWEKGRRKPRRTSQSNRWWSPWSRNHCRSPCCQNLCHWPCQKRERFFSIWNLKLCSLDFIVAQVWVPSTSQGGPWVSQQKERWEKTSFHRGSFVNNSIMAIFWEIKQESIFWGFHPWDGSDGELLDKLRERVLIRWLCYHFGKKNDKKVTSHLHLINCHIFCCIVGNVSHQIY